MFLKEIDEDPGISSRSVLLTKLERGLCRDTLAGSIVAPMSLEETTTDAIISDGYESPRHRNALFVMLTRRLHRVVDMVSPGRMVLFVPTPSISGDKAAVTSDCYHQGRGENVLQDEEDENNDGGGSRNYLEDLAAMHGIVLRSTDVDDDIPQKRIAAAAVVTAATGSTDTYEEQAIILVTSPLTMRNKGKRRRRRLKISTPSPSPSITTRSISKAKKTERLKHPIEERWEATLKTATAIARTNVEEDKLQLEKVASQKNFFFKASARMALARRLASRLEHER